MRFIWVEMYINEQMAVGYSYDAALGTADVRQWNSHLCDLLAEPRKKKIMAGLHIPGKKSRYDW